MATVRLSSQTLIILVAPVIVTSILVAGQCGPMSIFEKLLHEQKVNETDIEEYFDECRLGNPKLSAEETIDYATVLGCRLLNELEILFRAKRAMNEGLDPSESLNRAKVASLKITQRWGK